MSEKRPPVPTDPTIKGITRKAKQERSKTLREEKRRLHREEEDKRARIMPVITHLWRSHHTAGVLALGKATSENVVEALKLTIGENAVLSLEAAGLVQGTDAGEEAAEKFSESISRVRRTNSKISILALTKFNFRDASRLGSADALRRVYELMGDPNDLMQGIKFTRQMGILVVGKGVETDLPSTPGYDVTRKRHPLLDKVGTIFTYDGEQPAATYLPNPRTTQGSYRANQALQNLPDRPVPNYAVGS